MSGSRGLLRVPRRVVGECTGPSHVPDDASSDCKMGIEIECEFEVSKSSPSVMGGNSPSGTEEMEPISDGLVEGT